MDFAYAYNPLLLKPVLRRDRAIVGIALLILILLAWLKTSAGASNHVQSALLLSSEVGC